MVDGVKVICIGDHIECINGKNIVGMRHYEVARMLKELPRDQSFTLKLVEPMKAFGSSHLFTCEVPLMSVVLNVVCVMLIVSNVQKTEA